MPKYELTSKNIQEVKLDNPRTANQAVRWINVVNAGKKELEYLRKKYGFELPHLAAASASVISQRPAIHHAGKYIFLILHFPIYINDTIVASEVDFFVGHGFLITLHNGNLKALNEFFNLCKKDGESMLAFETESSAVLLYELLEKLMLACYPHLDQNSLAINKVEELIFSQEQRQAVSKILFLRQNVINFRKIMQAHKNILTKLESIKSSLVPAAQIKKFYKHLVDHSKTIWEILENQKEVIEILNSTNESLLNYRLSDIMKTLTIISVIVFPLTLLAAIFSMRTKYMPLVESNYGFYLIISIMFFIMSMMLLFFEKKKWLK